MKRGLIIVALLVGFLCPASAFWQSRDSNYNVAVSGAAPSYTGPGDVFSTSPVAAYSCSEAYNAAGASTAVNACDLVDSAAPTVTICTLRFTSTGKVDLTAYCPGSVTPAAKCAAATGGVCNISQAYDLTGNGRHAIQATAANQPTITFSSSPTGTLPAINCAANTNAVLQTSGTVTQAQPFTMAAVYMRTNTLEGGVVGGALGSSVAIGGSNAGANQAEVQFGIVSSFAATDNAWHFLGGLASGTGANGAINVDGTDSIGNTGGNSFSASVIRLCRANGIQHVGPVAEAQVWGAATTATNRNNLSANAHGAGRYNF